MQVETTGAWDGEALVGDALGVHDGWNVVGAEVGLVLTSIFAIRNSVASNDICQSTWGL